MKKISLFIVMMVSSVICANAQNLTFEGSIAALKSNGTYAVEFDYSNLHVENLPLEKFLATKDAKFNNDWESDIVISTENVAKSVPSDVNKKLVLNPEAPQYIFVIRLKALFLGNAGGQFVPFGGKVGGANITGQIDILDAKTRKVEGIVHFSDVQGVSSFSDKTRWSMAYAFLVKPMKKMVKKAK